MRIWKSLALVRSIAASLPAYQFSDKDTAISTSILITVIVRRESRRRSQWGQRWRIIKEKFLLVDSVNAAKRIRHWVAKKTRFCERESVTRFSLSPPPYPFSTSFSLHTRLFFTFAIFHSFLSRISASLILLFSLATIFRPLVSFPARAYLFP